MLPQQVLDYQMNGRIAGPQGNFDPMAAPHGVYRCLGEDKWVAIAVETEDQWAAFCQATGHVEWQEDERFADLFHRQNHREELDTLVAEWARELTALEIMETLQAKGVPAGPSQNAEDLIGDPQLWHRGQFMGMDHPEVGNRLMMAMQGVFSAIPERRYFPPPVFDQDNYFVFHEMLGLPKEEVEQLIEEGVIA
jgi:benzylsuccinate CoA-transferase BbsF subunit